MSSEAQPAPSFPDSNNNPVIRLFEMFSLKPTLPSYQRYLKLPMYPLEEVPKRIMKRRYQVSVNRYYTGQMLDRELDGAGVQVTNDSAIHEGYFRCSKQHGKGRMIDSTGSSLEGEWIDGIMQGIGSISHPSGAKYTGEIFNGMPHGEGKEVWTEGGSFTGNFKEGKKHGYGVFIWSKGNRYEGQFVSGFLQGRGTYKWADGRTYEGEWVGDEMHGNGVYVWTDGRKYHGEFQHGKKHGWGTIEEHSGVYTGEWVNGMKQGKGKLTYPDGRVVHGIWNENRIQQILSEGNADEPAKEGEEKPQGLEICVEVPLVLEEEPQAPPLADGDKESDKEKRKFAFLPGSDFKEEDKVALLKSTKFPSDVAIENFASKAALAKQKELGPFPFEMLPLTGEKFTPMVILTPTTLYRGELNDSDLRHGRGVSLQDGDIIEGTWEEDKSQGLGRKIHADGSVYFGYWANGSPHGFGVFRTVKAVVYAGEWLQGVRDGLGFEASSMMTYRGSYRNDYRHGEGRLELPREGVYVGTFEKDLRDGFGMWTSLEGTKYAGGWKEDHMEGVGVQSWTDGKQFMGHYKENRPGKGQYRRYLKETIDPISLFQLTRSATFPLAESSDLSPPSPSGKSARKVVFVKKGKEKIVNPPSSAELKPSRNPFMHGPPSSDEEESTDKLVQEPLPKLIEEPPAALIMNEPPEELVGGKNSPGEPVEKKPAAKPAQGGIAGLFGKKMGK